MILIASSTFTVGVDGRVGGGRHAQLAAHALRKVGVELEEDCVEAFIVTNLALLQR